MQLLLIVLLFVVLAPSHGLKSGISEWRAKLLTRNEAPAFVESSSAIRTQMPDTCKPLQAVHGGTLLNQWLYEVSSEAPSKTPTELCSAALDCKKLLAPLIVSGTQFKKACPKDCSGNGSCQGGACVCSPGYSGADCSTMRCPGNCSSHGECKLGRCFCFPGYDGSICEKTLDCPRGSNGRPCGGFGECRFGKCFCNPGYSGEKCDLVSRCPRDCMGRGFCLHGKCFCKPGYGSSDCSVELLVTRKCPRKCSARGACVRGRCHCLPGYYGRDCSKVVECPKGLYNDKVCSEHGSCGAGRCHCDPGWGGATCSIQLPCPGNGTCSSNGICLKGSCFCHPGYQGKDCSQESPCIAGCSQKGVCVNGFCKCLPGYYGKDCSQGDGTPLSREPTCAPSTKWAALNDQRALNQLLQQNSRCPSNCNGFGICLNGTCKCVPGFDGLDCQQQIQPLPCPNKCSYRGVCVFGKCHCTPPYSGPDCFKSTESDYSVDKCPKQCSGRGMCLKEGANHYCSCYPGFAGSACEISIPCKDNCNGRGICQNGKCFCFPGFEGGSCKAAAKCPNGCSKRGQCFYGKCFCDPYHAGEACDKTPHCRKGCHNGGRCVGQDTCACPSGWTGVACTEKLTCPNQCSGHGSCVATNVGTKCVCSSMYIGDDCSKRVDVCKNNCTNNGICVLGECSCNVGYNGDDCSIKSGKGNPIMKDIGASIAVANAATNASSTTVATPKFREVRFRSGVSEEQQQRVRAAPATPEAAKCPNGCSGHGVCANGQCFCDPGLEGDDCSQVIACPNDCSGHGLCKYGQCWCGADYVGKDCAILTSRISHFNVYALIGIFICLALLMGYCIGVVRARKSFARSGMSQLVEPTS